MSTVKVQGNAGGSGSVTIASPNTNSNYTQTLTAATGTIPITTSTVAFAPGFPVFENTQTLSTNYTVTTGSSAHSAGPITVSAGVTVTIPSGSRWVII